MSGVPRVLSTHMVLGAVAGVERVAVAGVERVAVAAGVRDGGSSRSRPTATTHT